MADLNLRRDRGQILLIAAFALAVVFLAFAILTNSAIFTENLASRGETTGSDEALVMRATAEENIGQSIETANYYDNSTQSTLLTAFRTSLQDISTQSEFISASSGVLTNVTYVSDRDGRRLNGSLPSVAGSVTPASGVEEARAFTINTTDLPTNDSSEDNFTIIANESGTSTRWITNISANSPNDQVIVETNRSDISETEKCRVQATPPYQIDVTRGQINGNSCSALRRNSTTGTNFAFGTGVSPGYNMTFASTTNLDDANYSVVVRDPDHNPGSPALYSVTTRFTYVGTDITYNTTIRVAPGEPDA